MTIISTLNVKKNCSPTLIIIRFSNINILHMRIIFIQFLSFKLKSNKQITINYIKLQ